MDIKFFMDALDRHDFSFFTGIPDSLLSVFCDELVNRHGANTKNHIVAHNEGGCVALASGYHLATGKVSCIYLQNSGIGNILNPVVSLTHPKVYGIPNLFIIGWRGEPGCKDEPQHLFQGEITLCLLETLEIDYFIIDDTTMPDDIEQALIRFNGLFQRGKSAAFVVKKSAFLGNNRSYSNNHQLNREVAIKIVLEASENDAIVSTTGKISRELFELRRFNNDCGEKDFLTVGSMGHSVMIALGIALHRPEHRIWCLDGDGALLMHMGGLGLVGNQQPEKFVHVLLNNVAHETVGGMPTVAECIDFSSIARSCGYQHVYKAKDEDSLKIELTQAKLQKGPVFIEVEIALGSRSDLGRPTSTTYENKKKFMDFISARG